MPMAFASLLGGIVTLVGTSPNILIAKRAGRRSSASRSGCSTTRRWASPSRSLGVAFLSFGYRLLPRGRKAAASMDAAFNLEDYTAEAHLPDDSPLVGRTVSELEALGDGEVMVATIIRERFRRFYPRPAGSCGPTTSSCSRGSPRGWSAWSRGRASGSPTRSGPPTARRRRAARRRGGRGDRRLADPGPHRRPRSASSGASASPSWRSAAAGSGSRRAWRAPLPGRRRGRAQGGGGLAARGPGRAAGPAAGRARTSRSAAPGTATFRPWCSWSRCCSSPSTSCRWRSPSSAPPSCCWSCG